MSFRTVAGIAGSVLLISVLFYLHWWVVALLLLPVGPLLVWYFTKEQRWQRTLLTTLAAWLALIAGAIWLWLAPSQPLYLQANGVAFDGERIFVSDMLAHRIAVFDTNLNLLAEWPGNVGSPAGLALGGDGRLLVADPLHHRYALTADGEHYEFGPGGFGTAFGLYRYPQDVAADRNNRFYIADTGNHRVVILNATTKTVETNLDIPGGAPRGLAISPADQSLLVADSFNNRVLVYDSVYRTTKFTLPISNTLLSNPGDVIVDGQGTIFVADTGNGRIAIFYPNGEFKGEIAPALSWSPSQLALGPGNDLLVVDALAGKLFRINSNNEVVGTLGEAPLAGSVQAQRILALILALIGVSLALVALLAAWAIAGLNIAPWWELKSWPAVWLMSRTVGALLWPARFNVTRQKVLDGHVEAPMRQLGPNLVFIQGASAVALERGGTLTRILLPGTVITEPGEVIRNVFDLRLQTRHVDQTREAVYSRDAIPLEMKFTIQYRIIQDETTLVTKGRYEVRPEDLRRAALNAKDWHEQTEQAAREVLREVITTRRVEEIFDPRKTHIGFISPRAPLQHEMRRRLMQLTPRWGVEVISVTLDEIRLPEKVRERLLQVWDVEWHHLVEVGRVQTEVWELQKRKQFERDEQRYQLEAQLEQAQLRLTDMRNKALAEWEVERLGLDAELEAEQRRLQYAQAVQPERSRLQEAIQLLELRLKDLQLEQAGRAALKGAQVQAEVSQIGHDQRVTEASSQANLDRQSVQDKAQAEVTMGRAKALARVEYLRQILNLLREDEDVMQNADPQLWQLVTRLVAFADVKDITALANFLARETALPEKADGARPAEVHEDVSETYDQ